ncbi:MAG: pyrimidine/purine nucleotide monophosphate nucleosidase domain-containing protein [Desulfovibrionaceae bacterium]
MSIEVTIPIIPRQLGVTELGPREGELIRKALCNGDHRLVEIIGALINIHKKDYNDTRAVREKFRNMRVQVERRNGKWLLVCTDVPMDCLYDGKRVIEQSVEQVSAALRDMVFPPTMNMAADTPTPAERSAYVKKFVEHAGLLYRGERGLVVFTWGGHRISREEYDFAKVLAYWLGLFLPDMENITGCGDGIMKAPFKGCQVAYGKQRTFKRFGLRDYIGFTEQGILAAEAPNELVNRLVVFPTIEQRMEAFIRASHRGRAHPGGPGTIEEIMTMLAVLSTPENSEIPFAFELVEQSGGTYFKELDEYLHTCFHDALDDLYEVHCCQPQTYARHVAETTRKLPMRYLWNDDFYFEERLQTPFEVSFDSMEGLDLSRNQEPFSLLINLRRFFSSVVHLSVKDPDMLDEWGDERPLIRGDRDILRATDEMVRKLERQGRIHPEKKYATPYRVA